MNYHPQKTTKNNLWHRSRRVLLMATVGAAVTLSLNSCEETEASPSETATASLQTVESFVRALESGDSTTAYGLIADENNIFIRMTFTGNAEPNPVYTGKAASVGYIRQIFARFRQVRWNDKLFNATNGETVFFEGTGDFITRQGEIPYRNVYVFRFRVANGRITEVHEYYNPVTINVTFGNPRLGQ